MSSSRDDAMLGVTHTNATTTTTTTTTTSTAATAGNDSYANTHKRSHDESLCDADSDDDEEDNVKANLFPDRGNANGEQRPPRRSQPVRPVDSQSLEAIVQISGGGIVDEDPKHRRHGGGNRDRH